MTTTMGSLSPVATTKVFDALSHPLRLRTVRILDGFKTPLAVKDLAVEIVRAQRDESDDEISKEQVERVHTMLHHHHVPKLADYGLVEYDTSENRVALDDSVPFEEIEIFAN